MYINITVITNKIIGIYLSSQVSIHRTIGPIIYNWVLHLTSVSMVRESVKFRRLEVVNMQLAMLLGHGCTSLTGEKDHHYLLKRFVCVGVFFDG